jgi:hypothetical protein
MSLLNVLKSATRRRGQNRRTESGDTLVEVLLALVVLGLASVALIIAFTTSISASADHRKLATTDTVLTTASQEIISAIQNQPSLFTAACTSSGQPIPMTNYPDYSASVGFPLPSPYSTTTYDVQYQTINATTGTYPVEWWNGTSYGTTCLDNEPQLITIALVGTTYTNSFVVDFPAGNSGGSSGSLVAQQLVFLNNGTIGGGPSGSPASYAGNALSVQPEVAVETSDGTIVTTDYSNVTIAIDSGTGVLSNCSGNEVLGVTTFTGCTIGSGGTYTLQATDSSMPVTQIPPQSNSFPVTASSYHLVFGVQPVGGASGSAFDTLPTVNVEDSLGHTNTSWTGTITFTLSGGQLNGCVGQQTGSQTIVTVTATAGVATLSSGCDFSGGYFYNPNSSPSVSETQYTMTATATPSGSSGSAIPAISNAFAVNNPGLPSQLAFVTEPTGVGNSSPTTAFPLNPTVEVEDAFGNIENSFTSTYTNTTVAVSMYLGTVSTSPSTAQTLTGCTPSFSNGIYTLTSCAGSKVNDGLLLYATGSFKNAGATVTLTSATSTPFNITGAATQLLFTTQPVAGASGSAFTKQPVLVYKDGSGHVVTAETASVTPSVSGGTLSSCTNLAPTLGIVTVANCTFAGLDTGSYTMSFTGGGLTSAASNAFTPTGPGPAAQLVFVSPAPVAAAADAVMSTQPSVQVEDSAGNHVSTSNASVTFSATGNGVIANCTDLTALAGTVNASSCTFGGNVGTAYNLIASSGSLTPAQSASVQVTGPGPVSQILLVPSCASTITVTSHCVLTATLEDNFQNVETSDNASVVTFSALPANSFTGLGNLTVSGGITGGDTVTAASTGSISLSASADGVTSNAVVITVNGLPSVATTTLSPATRTQSNYLQTLVGTGGTAPYTWSLTSGALPTGLSLNGSTGVISGAVGSSATSATFSVTITDADGVTATKSLSITVNVVPTVTTSSLPTATQTQTSYSQTLAGTGGTVPYAWSVTTGSLPSGLSLNAATGVISGTVGSSATTQIFTVTLTDVNGVTATHSLTLTVNAKPTISPTTLPAATQTGVYSQTLTVSGGVTPFGAWSVSSGTLPTGLSLNTSTGVISGTVGASAVTQTFSIQTTDANGVAAIQSFTLTVNLVPNITTTTLPGATSTGAYSQTLAVTGGTGPFTWSLSAGTLPTGLTLNTSTGAITGSSVTGTTQTFTVKAIDANGVFDTQALTLTVNPVPSVTTTSLATATQTETGYAQTIVGSGGTTFYSWSVTTGALPTGLSLNSASGVISGTVGASATTQTFTVTLTDANGVKATKSLTLTVNVVPNITTTTLAAATQTQTGYTQTLAVTGGTTPYVGWSIATGTLPTGLSLNASTGVISGTVGSSATTQTFTVQLTDANAVSDTQVLTLTVNTAPSITTASLPAATNSGAYSQTVTETGGTTPLTWSISTGTLPTGLTLNTSTGAITGSSVTGTTQTFTIKATDAYGVFGTKSLTITVNAAPNITTTTLATATQTQTGYSQTLAVSNGTTPFTWSLSSGSLPLGLSLSSAGVISGTVSSSAATQTFTVKATDVNGAFDTQSLTITVNAAPNITTSSLQGATKSNTYSQTLAVSNGTTPFTWSLSSGSLPLGLSLSSAGVISGTVSSSAATQTFTVKATDVNGAFDTQSLTITVNAAPNITTSSLQGATKSNTYSQTLAVSNGTTPFTWSLSSGSLPLGLSLSSAGVISGTVSSSAATQTFTVKATDVNGAFDTQSLTITVNAAPNITTSTLGGATRGFHTYTQTLAVSGGTASFTWSLTSGTLPAGLSLNASTGVISGTDITGADGTYNFTVRVTDANGAFDTQALTIVVSG